MSVLNIAIDGPAGAGKSTVAKAVAKSLNIAYLDTGAMYRAVAYFCVQQGVNVADEKAVLPLLDEIELEIQPSESVQKVILNGVDITGGIRTPEMGMNASTVSKIHAVRLKLVEMQRAIAAKSACVLDGRDIGTLVLPNAPYKFFLTADAKERAMRRFKELVAKGLEVNYDTILAEVIARDKQDVEKDFGALKQADDAILIDSTDLQAAEVVNEILSRIKK
ncbi:MAG: (d)CMP kinase [Christensenellaceae bacterium]|jgi:cytidylate kinase|nr:(d)CMP kinase [Christensenellaceae bacterium]